MQSKRIASLAALLFCSCSALDSMDSMKKNTQSMRKDTHDMSSNFGKTQDQIGNTNSKMDETNRKMDETNRQMGETNRKMENMTNSLDQTNSKMSDMTSKLDTMTSTMDKMYTDLRQGDSMQARVKSMEMMEQTPELGAKVTHAAHYLLSFEYQLWKGDYKDTPERRQSLMNDAVRELATDLQRYIADSAKITTATEDDKLKNLFALAMCIDMNNPGNESALRARGLEPVSMFDLIRSALSAGRRLQEGTLQISALPPYVASVLEYENDFTYLLQLRSNIYPAMVVGALSNADSDAFMGLKGAWSKANIFLHPWEAKTSERNLVQIRLYSKWIQDAAALRIFLQENSFGTKEDELLFRVLRNMRIKELDAEAASFNMAPERKAELQSLSESLSQLLGR